MDAYKTIADMTKKLQKELETANIKVDTYDIEATVSPEGELLPLESKGVRIRFVLYSARRVQPYTVDN